MPPVKSAGKSALDDFSPQAKLIRVLLPFASASPISVESQKKKPATFQKMLY